jgi:hypothetical protein
MDRGLGLLSFYRENQWPKRADGSWLGSKDRYESKLAEDT